jgi:hypothetical protein
VKQTIRGIILAFSLLGLIWVAFDIHHRFLFCNLFAGIALASRLLREKRSAEVHDIQETHGKSEHYDLGLGDSK